MNKYRVILTPEAENDLREIYRYIASVLQEQAAAHRLVAKIKDAILDLETMPERWNLYHQEPWESRGLRKAVVGNYIIFYYLQGQSVFVISILYGKRDIETILSQRGPNGLQ